MAKVLAKAAATKPPPLHSQKQEPIFTKNLWKPVTATAAYLLFLRVWSEMRPSDADGTLCSEAWFSPAVAATAFLLALVRYGPHMMEGRKPVNVIGYMFTYNLYQVILNAWCVAAFSMEITNKGMSLWGNSFDATTSGVRLSFLIWVHYNNMFVEILNTVFVVLRKRPSQLTFVHVWHRVLLIWSWYAVCRIECGGDAYFAATMNSLMNVVVYSHYLWSSMDLKLNTKKTVTRLQLAQFVICFCHALYVLSSGPTNRWLALLQLFVMTNMLGLFTVYYWDTYPKEVKSMEVEIGEMNFLHPSKKYTIIKDVCYDITEFSERHPGGKHLVALAIGRDASILFDSYHVTDRPYNYLKSVPAVGKVGDAKVMQIIESYKMRGSEWKQIPEAFPQPNNSDLYQRLKKRINAEILAPRGRTSGRGGPVMVATAFIVPTVWAILQVWYIFSPSILSGICLGLWGVVIGVALQHTANHGALLNSGLMNQIVGYSADVGIGVSSLVWRFHHQVSHHIYTNDDYLDIDAFSSYPVIRLDSAQELQWFMKYQHLYAWPLFGVLYLAKQQSDIENLCIRSVHMVKFLGTTEWEVPLAVTLKIIHYFLMVFIPLALHGDVWVWGPAFVAWVLSGGIVLSWFFIVSHNIGETKVDPPRETPDWCRQQIEHSASWGGHFGCLMTGGLNLQVEHHLFPGVSHDLYADIQKLVKEECAKDGIHYAGYDSLFEITLEFLTFMKRMGSESEPDFSHHQTESSYDKKRNFFKAGTKKMK